MKQLFAFILAFLVLSNSSCSLFDNGCDQDLSGTYIGQQSCFNILGSETKTITLTIEGEDGDYIVSAIPNSALHEEDLEQDGCGFNYQTGPIGNKTSGEITIEGDSIFYSTSGDSFGVVPCTFKGVRQ